MKKSVSQKQLEANRRNSKVSTGPRTAEGKAKVRWNALKHGLLASSVVLDIDCFGERQEDFYFLLREFTTELVPIGVLEEICVEKIAVTYWRLRRVMRAEAGEIGKGWLEVGRREAEAMDMAESMSKVLTSAPLEKTYCKSAAGIDAILELLSLAKSEISKQGCVDKNTQKLLFRMFGKGEDAVSVAIALNCKVALQRQSLIKKDPKKYEQLPTEEALKKEALETIEYEYGYYQSIIDLVEQSELKAAEIDQLSLNVPSAEVSQKTLRYEAALERQLSRAMDQLERLQRRRLGDNIPSPVFVNDKVDN